MIKMLTVSSSISMWLRSMLPEMMSKARSPRIELERLPNELEVRWSPIFAIYNLHNVLVPIS